LNSAAHWYIGIMSGTSLDGADALLADLSSTPFVVSGFVSEPFSADLRSELLALNRAGDNEIERAARASNQLAAVYAKCVDSLLAETGITRNAIRAIGCHGQTIRHRPDLGFTIQLNNPARLAELSAIDVVADFRSRDVAAGGEGAPLAPAFHDGVFRSHDETRVAVNIGGIANITVLEPGQPAWGFDCGPGNCLMDAWIQQHRHENYDRDGAWAASGRVIPELLDQLTRERYFALPAPKSTGRDLFHMEWLTRHLQGSESPADVQATLLELTAISIADHIHRYAANTKTIIICGGGASNAQLLKRIGAICPETNVSTSEAFGVPPQQVEALAFAWLAKQAIERHRIDLTRTTGAKHTNILGAVYPA
jgi:anhydro-N-acetylmuramic acid kinase